MAGDDGVTRVDQNGIGETEDADTLGDLANLYLRVGPRIARKRNQGVERLVLHEQSLGRSWSRELITCFDHEFTSLTKVNTETQIICV